MNAFRFNEKALSQIPALQLLQGMGYTYLTYDEVQKERLGRNSNVLLEGILRKQLMAMNRIQYKEQEYLFSEANIQEAVQRLKSIPFDGLVKTNEKIYDHLTLGTALEQAVDGDSKSFTLKYIDWQNPQNNVFHVTAEFEVERSRSADTRRPDIVLFVNGIPLAVIECKSAIEDVKQGVSQHIRNQTEDQIPHLFVFSQLLISANKNEVLYATAGTPAKFWAKWREKEDRDTDIELIVKTPLTVEQKTSLYKHGFAEEQAVFDHVEEAGGRSVTEQDRILYALCRPERLIDLTRRFIVFDGPDKKIARYQQFFAVKNVIGRVKDSDADGRRRGGVIWHTQGSGKSLTMVMMARALVLDPDIRNPRIVLVTDRTDLDVQLKDTFRSCGLEPQQAQTGRHLLELVQQNKASVITTVINKFDTAMRVQKFEETSRDIFILIDESHRTQYGSFHAFMKRMFPNACYLGFTGTPLMKKEKSTADKFGGIIDKYTIDQAVKDGAVVPLLYEGRHVEQQVNRDAIDTWFERVCEGLTEEQKVDLKKKYSRAEMLNKTEQTIQCRAYDISAHYRQNWQGTGFKAQLCAPSKLAAIQYHEFLQEIGDVTSDVIISPPDDREGYESVDEEPTDKVLQFWQRMMKRYGSEEEYNKQIVNRFKAGEEPEILIVVDKLLTGFDAPRNTVLYICKSLEGHNLLQAIARVNRLYEKKDFGYILDYQGLLEKLDRALTEYGSLEAFDEEDLKGALISVSEEVGKLPQHHANLWDCFKDVANKHDEESYELALADEKRRHDFYESLSQFSKTLGIALSSEQFLVDTPDRKIKSYKEDLKTFQKLKMSVRRRYQEIIDYKDYEPKIQKLLDTHITATNIIQITQPVNIFDDTAFEQALAEQGSSSSKADLIASAVKRTITENMAQDPAFYQKFSDLIQKAIADFRAKRITDLEYLKWVKEIRDTIVHRNDEDVPADIAGNSDLRAFYGLVKPFLEKHVNDNDRLSSLTSETAKEIFEIIKARKIVNLWNNEDAQKTIVNLIDDYLYDVLKARYGVPLDQDDMDSLIEKSMQLARNRNLA